MLLCVMISLVLSTGCKKGRSADSGENAPLASSGMRLIKSGTFQMGSNDTLFPDEQPVHQVSVSSFYLDTIEVTQSDYMSLMQTNPSNNKNDIRCPVELVTWFDAVLYCNARSKRDKLDTVYSYSQVDGAPNSTCYGLVNLNIDMSKNGYRLPTEAEWEYACRSESKDDFYWGGSYPPQTSEDSTMLDEHTVWTKNAQTTAPVASKKPNRWGIYDISGNVREWCNDWYGPYLPDDVKNPQGGPEGDSRVVRGGSWFFNSKFVRSASRSRNDPAMRDPNLGFRCVRSSR